MGLVKLLAASLVAFCCLALTGCGPATAAAQPEGRLKVVTTTGMLGDLVRQIGGDRVSVTSLMGPGVDPHLYKPRPSDLRALDQANLIVYHGIDLEGRMGKVFAALPERSFAAADLPRDLLMLADDTTEIDPHIWFDLSLWRKVTERVANRLIEADPSGAPTYRANLASYLARHDQTDQTLRQVLSEIPEGQRVLVTAHDAFRYFGKAYGVEVVAIQGTNTAAESGASDLRRIAELIAERKIKAIFVESSVPPATINALQRAVQDRGWDVKIGGSLYSDALGDPGTPAADYLGMILTNGNTIAEALR